MERSKEAFSMSFKDEIRTPLAFNAANKEDKISPVFLISAISCSIDEERIK